MGAIDKVLQVFLACVLATAIAALSACGNGDAKSDVARPRLENGSIVFPQDSPQLGSFATEPVKESAPQQLRLPGRLVWDENRTVRLFPAFAGRVIHILVKAGDRVKQGETLAVLASPDFGQAQADARRAQSDFALAEKNLSRLRELHAAGVSPRKELITAEADYARAEAELARASGKIKLYGGGSESVDQNLALSSPIDGILVNRDRKLKGEMFVAAELQDRSRADLQLPERALVLSGGSYYVFVEETPGRFAWSEVKIEGVRDGVAGVVSGVNLGQKVVVEGTLLLHRLYRQLAGGAPA